MRIAADISLYPLQENLIPPIRDVIERLKKDPELDVVTNPMSTQIRGEYDRVMDLLQTELKATFEALPKAVFVIKVLNNPIAD
jgi:uncharacterized protein YqgV (UPF0045/DUF77 family)